MQGIRRQHMRWDKQAAEVWSLVRYCACSCYENSFLLHILLALFSFSPLICIISRVAWLIHAANWGSRWIATPRLVLSIMTISRIWEYPTGGCYSRTRWIIRQARGNEPKIIRGCKKRRIIRTWGPCGSIRIWGDCLNLSISGWAWENKLLWVYF